MFIICNNMIHYGNFLCVCNVFLSYSSLLPSFVFPLPTVPFFFPISPTSLFFSMAQWVSLGLFTGAGKSLFTELCASYHWLHHWRQSLSLPHYLFPMDKPQTMKGLTCPSPFHGRPRLVEILCRCLYLLWIQESSIHVMPSRIHTASPCPFSLALIFFWLLPWCSLSFGEVVGVPFMTRFSTMVFSLNFESLKSLLTLTKRCFSDLNQSWQQQKCSPYEQKHSYLENNKTDTFCAVNKTTAVAWTHDLPSHWLLTKHTVSNRKYQICQKVGYAQNRLATIVPADSPHLASWYL